MLEIHKEKIRLSQGDHVTMKMVTKFNGEEYALQHGDVVEFTISKQDIEIINKTFTSNLIVLTANETAKLKPGKYRYDIKMHFNEGVDIALTYPHDLEVVERL